MYIYIYTYMYNHMHHALFSKSLLAYMHTDTHIHILKVLGAKSEEAALKIARAGLDKVFTGLMSSFLHVDVGLCMCVCVCVCVCGCLLLPRQGVDLGMCAVFCMLIFVCIDVFVCVYIYIYTYMAAFFRLANSLRHVCCFLLADVCLYVCVCVCVS